MAFSAGTLWRVRTGGSSSNGGGFDPTVGSPGTNYTIQDAQQITYTDMVIDATTNTKFTSAGNPVTSAHVGNVVNVTSGTGFTVQRVVIISQSAGVATCDKSLGTLGSTGGNGRLGGAFAAPENASSVAIAGNTVYIEAGSYTKTTTRSISCSGSAAAYIKWIGVLANEASPSDSDLTEASMPVFTSATNSNIIFTFTNASYNYMRNIKVTHTAGTRGPGWENAGSSVSSYCIWVNCICDGCNCGWDTGFNSDYFAHAAWISCENRNSTLTVYGGWLQLATPASTYLFYNCISRNNAGDGFQLGNNNDFVTMIGCLAYSNGRDGVRQANTATAGTLIIDRCTFNGNTGSGLHCLATTAQNRNRITNSIFSSNTRYGLEVDTASVSAVWYQGNNALYNNTLGARLNAPTGNGDITLSATPYTNSGSGDFSLNNTSGGGLDLKGTGLSSVVGSIGSTTSNFVDIGASQAQPPGVAFTFGS